MNFFERVVKIDRRIIFLLLFLTVSVPYLVPFKIPVTVIPETKRVFDFIEGLDSGSDPVLISFDYSPDTVPEVDPMAVAILRHCFHREVKVFGYTPVIEAFVLGEQTLFRVAKECGKEYGKDFVYLGFKPEIRPVINSMGEEIRNVFLTDFRNVPLDDLPMMRKVHNFNDISLVMAVSADDVSMDWINVAYGTFGATVAMGVVSHSYARVKPFLDAGQLYGLIAGMKGAAEYESLLLESRIIEKPGDGTRGMDSQSGAHLLIIAFLILGNLGYAFSRGKRGRE